MRNLMIRVYFGECFLIFCNIFLVSMEEEHTTIWEKEPGVPSTPSNTSYPIYLDSEIRELIFAEEINRFEYHHYGDESQSISFLISACKTAEIQWILIYKPENETSEVTSENVPPEILTDYRGSSPHIYIGKARRGSYFLELWSLKSTLTFFVYVTVDPAAIDLLRRFGKMNQERAITFKKNLKNPSLTFKWPEWSWPSWENQNIVYYVVTWHDKKYISSACELEVYERTSTLWATKTSQVLEWSGDRGPTPGKTYYVSVFIKTQHNFLLPYLQGHVTFPKSSPLTLKDGIATEMKLTPDDDKLTFRYKVRSRQFPGSENEILWYVISCVGTVQIEINHRKDTVLKKQLVVRYKAFKILNPNIGNRYVLKVTNSDGLSENEDFDKNIKVFATMRSKLFPFPNVTNFDLRLSRNHNIKNKTSYTVEWTAASDKNPVHYCMRVYSKRDQTNNHVWEINQCTKMKKKLDTIGHFVARNCTTSKNSSIVKLPIDHLDPLTDYVVYVSARKQGFKQHRLWYNTLYIPGNDFY